MIGLTLIEQKEREKWEGIEEIRVPAMPKIDLKELEKKWGKAGAQIFQYEPKWVIDYPCHHLIKIV